MQIPCQVLQATAVQRKLQEHPHLPLLLPREKGSSFLFPSPDPRLEMSCVALANTAFPEDNARLSQDLEQERIRCLLNTLQEHNRECLPWAPALHRALDRRIPNLAPLCTLSKSLALPVVPLMIPAPVAQRFISISSQKQELADLRSSEQLHWHTGSCVRKQTCCMTKCNWSTWDKSQHKALTSSCPATSPHIPVPHARSPLT